MLLRSRMSRQVVIIISICVLMYMASTYFLRNKRNTTIEKLSPETLAKLQTVTACKDRDFEPRIEMRNEFWILKNYVRAAHGTIHCHETVTFTTHATANYLDHLEELVVQWRAPISLAIHAPGADFKTTINSIRFLRECVENSDLIKELVTFHIFFSYKHFPENVPHSKDFMYDKCDCFDKPPYHVLPMQTYTQKERLLYPVNIARNIARDAAITHFVLNSDIDFYPSPNLAPKFLKMIARNAWPLNIPTTFPRVFPLALFQLNANSSLPLTKLELKEMIANQNVSNYSDRTKEAFYPNIPDVSKWIEVKESEIMDVISTGMEEIKELWSPIFIGTHQDPHFHEHLSWEGQNDKISQAYIMCIQDYHYLILNDAFLTHSANFKPYGRYGPREDVVYLQDDFQNNILRPQLKKLFGTNPRCSL